MLQSLLSYFFRIFYFDVIQKMWDSFKNYLLIDVKLTDSYKNIGALKSRFVKIEKYFATREWTRENFNALILEMKGQGAKPSTINNIIKIGKHYDKFLKADLIQDYTYFHEKLNDIETLTAEEVESIAKIKYPYDRLAKERNLRDFIVISFLFGTACRIGELQNLLWDDVKNSPVPHITFRDTKNLDDRVVPITENMYSLLQVLPRNGIRVFNSRSGKLFSSTEFNINIKKRADLCGIKKNVYAHIFRHSRITHLRSVLKFPLADVAVFAGHKDPKTTMRYDHPLLEHLSVLAYASPFEKDTPLLTLGNLIKDYAMSIINSKVNQVELNFTSNKEISIRLLTI